MEKKTINELGRQAYLINKEKGYCDGPVDVPRQLCLIHSEVSEALEADRHGRRCSVGHSIVGTIFRKGDDERFRKAYADYAKGTFEEEMADIVIRVASLCEQMGVDLDFHVQAKIRYNQGSGAKRY